MLAILTYSISKNEKLCFLVIQMHSSIIDKNIINESELSIMNKFCIQKQKLVDNKRFFQKKRALLQQLVSGHLQILSNNNQM
tara:strand:+ start:363 stop:608 length:246 start_codon:yes stop_codon:yes gene_type:complete